MNKRLNFICQFCLCTNFVKNGKTKYGKQRYQCILCGAETVNPPNVLLKNNRIINAGNVLAFSCIHIPFTRDGYLDFLIETVDKYKCKTIICLGDMFDNHSINYHEHDPDGHSPGEEFAKSNIEVKKWIDAFPDMYICTGNHDTLPLRKTRTFGLPSVLLKSYNQIWGLPDTWHWDTHYIADDVKYMHGTGKTGKYMHMNWATENMMSTVTGHTHSSLGIDYQASHEKLIFGMGVGCGININAYSMMYGESFSRRPIIGCGVVLEKGTHPIIVPMNLNKG